MPFPMSRFLLIDLNNFAGYPSIAIGYLVAALRAAQHEVVVVSPLAVGVAPPAREVEEGFQHYWERRISYSTRKWVAPPRHWLGKLRSGWRERNKRKIVDACRKHLQGRYSAILISAYTDELLVCEEIARVAQQRGTPLLIGGPIFSQEPVAQAWAKIPGVTAVIGSESERSIVPLVEAAASEGDLGVFPGVYLPDGRQGPKVLSERELENLPVPDFADFPWPTYKNRVIPLLASRGCGWGKCSFCGDIVTANGRGFRSRAISNVIQEMAIQSRRYATKDFAFLDLKLNSRPMLWRELIEAIGSDLPGARWIGAVHVQADSDCGLSIEDLRRAKAAGLTRVTFGLESGSQRILDSMHKGTRVDRNVAFVHDAHDVGISVRATVIQGYPGETVQDLNMTAEMLESVSDSLDRVRINRLNVLEGTRLAADYARRPDLLPGLDHLAWNHVYARSRYRYSQERNPEYREAIRRVLGAVHAINRKPIHEGAEVFHGLM